MPKELELQRLQEGVSWLIGLRWVATVWVCVGTLLAGRLLRIGVVDNAIYGLVGLLALYNLLLWIIARHLRGWEPVSVLAFRRLVGVQMTVDLFLLTAIFHFSGGVENPFVFFYVFHVLIASILLSVRESCFQATVAVLLFAALISLEFTGVLPHHCLTGFVSQSQHTDAVHVYGTLFGFATAMYLVVYLGGFVAERLRRAEMAQSQANDQLRQKDHIKDEYVYRVSHNIKGHLAAIQSCLSVASPTAGLPQDQREEFVQRALQRTRGLTRFVKDLLGLTQMRLNNRVVFERFSFDHAVRQAVAVVMPNAQARAISLTYAVPDTSVFVSGSAVVVEEVITNILSNAIKYTSDHGSITLTVTAGETEVAVDVVDTGVGIPADEVEHVFDELYRASNVCGMERDGSGMGLTLVKHLVERYGGHIELTSELGIGTRVQFTLPRGDSDACQKS